MRCSLKTDLLTMSARRPSTTVTSTTVALRHVDRAYVSTSFFDTYEYLDYTV